MDCDRTNNRVENLQWTNRLDNMNHNKRLAHSAYDKAIEVMRDVASGSDNQAVLDALSECEARLTHLSNVLKADSPGREYFRRRSNLRLAAKAALAAKDQLKDAA